MRSLLSMLLAAVLGVLVALPASAAPASDPWPHWETHDPKSTLSVDHTPLAVFLARYGEMRHGSATRIRYGAVTPADHAALQAYIDMLAGQPVSRLARPEQMAFWINLYNALTIAIVLEHYPVDSIRDIDTSPGFFSQGPWGEKRVTVEGLALSLDDIEHRILRPIWRDPRIHYAINCAALGCPDLRLAPFEAGRLEEQLDHAARRFINSPRGVLLDKGRLVVSSIYDWFEEDFGGSEMAVIRHLLAYAEPGLAMQLQRYDEIDDYRYDWGLNDAP